MYGILRKAVREGTNVKLEYGSQYGSNRKAKKTTKKKDGHEKQDESTPVSDNEEDSKPVRFQLARNLQGGQRMQTSATWNEYMRRYWVKDNFIEPYHPGQKPFERDQALWKQDSTKIMIESKVDPRGWFRVMCHTADLHNHRANSSNEDNIP